MQTNVGISPPYSPPNIALLVSAVFFGAICAFSLEPYLNLVEQLGFRIPQDNMMEDYVTALIWAAFLGACIIFSPIRDKDKNMLLWAWLIKCFVSLFVLLFYEAHYPSDSEGYFMGGLIGSHAGIIGELLLVGYDSHKMDLIIMSYNDIVPDIVKNSYHSLKISFSMIGLMAMYLLYRTSILITKRENRMFFWVLVLFPSLLIYTSRIGKEPLMAFGIAIYAAGLVNWHCKGKTVYLFVGLIGLFVCSFLRIWVCVLLIAPLFFYFFYSSKSFFSKAACTLLVGILIFLSYSLLLNKFGLNGIVGIYKKLEFVIVEGDLGGSAINRPPIVINGPLDIIKHAPDGLFTALFRPLPWDIPSLLGLASGGEGLLLLCLFFRATIRTQLRELNDPILAWAIVLVFSWALLYGFLIQNFGTGVRWKTQILPIFLGLLLYLGRFRSKDLKPSGSKTLNLPVLKK